MPLQDLVGNSIMLTCGLTKLCIDLFMLCHGAVDTLHVYSLQNVNSEWRKLKKFKIANIVSNPILYYDGNNSTVLKNNVIICNLQGGLIERNRWKNRVSLTNR